MLPADFGLEDFNCRQTCASLRQRCPELRLDLIPGMLRGERYPHAEDADSAIFPCFPGVDEHEMPLPEGRRVPLGTRARNEAGKVEVVPRSVHENYRVTRSLVLPPAGESLEIHPGVPLPSAIPGRCPICFADEPEEAVTFRCKQHPVCKECAARFFEDKLAVGALPKCPVEGCGADAGAQLAQAVLTYVDFNKFLLANLRATKRLQNCPDCGTAVFLEEGRPRRSSGECRRRTGGARLVRRKAPPPEEKEEPNTVRCPECQSCFCIICTLPTHPDMSCEDARKAKKREEPQQLSAELQDLPIKECPRCGVLCEKADDAACDHMTCYSCGKQFCWTCLEDREVIYAHGNHHHLPTCRFFFAYDGPLEYRPERCWVCKRDQRPCVPPMA